MSTVEPNLMKLEDSGIWKEACSLAEHMYGTLHEFPEEEKWETVRKLRAASNDSMFYVAQAVGSSTPRGSEFDWSNARKQASAMKTMYRFAGRQKFIELEPEIMLRIDKLIAQIDSQIIEADKQGREQDQKDLETWHKKYKLMKEIES